LAGLVPDKGASIQTRLGTSCSAQPGAVRFDQRPEVNREGLRGPKTRIGLAAGFVEGGALSQRPDCRELLQLLCIGSGLALFPQVDRCTAHPNKLAIGSCRQAQLRSVRRQPGRAESPGSRRIRFLRRARLRCGRAAGSLELPLKLGDVTLQLCNRTPVLRAGFSQTIDFGANLFASDARDFCLEYRCDVGHRPRIYPYLMMADSKRRNVSSRLIAVF